MSPRACEAECRVQGFRATGQAERSHAAHRKEQTDESTWTFLKRGVNWHRHMPVVGAVYSRIGTLGGSWVLTALHRELRELIRTAMIGVRRPMNLQAP